MSKQLKPLGVAVVGTGYWGSKLVHEYATLSRAEPSRCRLVKVVDSSSTRLRKLGQSARLPRESLGESISDATDDASVDAIHIATPSETHFLLGSEALKHGKHVLVEKPMAMTSREAFKLARLAEERGKVLQVGHIFRFNNAVAKAKELLSAGRIGHPLYVNMSWTALVQPVPERDIIFDLAPHPVDILNLLLDEWPINVSCRAKSYAQHESGREEVAFASLEFPDEVMASVHLSWLQPGPKTRRVVIVGEDGVLDVDTLEQTLTNYKPDNSRLDIPVKANNTIADMILHFLSTIRGVSTPSNSALVGAININVLEALRESLTHEASVPVMSP